MPVEQVGRVIAGVEQGLADVPWGDDLIIVLDGGKGIDFATHTLDFGQHPVGLSRLVQQLQPPDPDRHPGPRAEGAL